jgi:hypothetical protein
VGVEKGAWVKAEATCNSQSVFRHHGGDALRHKPVMGRLAKQVNEAVTQLDSAWRGTASGAAARKNMLTPKPKDNQDSDAHLLLMQVGECKEKACLQHTQSKCMSV